MYPLYTTNVRRVPCFTPQILEDMGMPSSTPVILCYPVLSRYDALDSLLYASYTIQHFIALLPDY